MALRPENVEGVATLDPTLDAVLHEFGDDVEKIVGRGLAGVVASAAVLETLRRGYIAQW